jgi:hypothetical protein
LGNFLEGDEGAYGAVRAFLVLEILLQSLSFVFRAQDKYGSIDSAENVEEDLVPEILSDACEIRYHRDVERLERGSRSDSYYLLTKESLNRVTINGETHLTTWQLRGMKHPSR